MVVKLEGILPETVVEMKYLVKLENKISPHYLRITICLPKKS